LPKRNILLVGPLPPPAHGQSLAFAETINGIKHHYKFSVNQNVSGKSILEKIIMAGKALARISFLLFSQKIDLLYFTCSRSKLGALFDIYLINLASFRKAKIINHLHGKDFKNFYNSLPGLFKKVFYKSYLKISTSLVLNAEMKKEFTTIFPRMRVEVISHFYSKNLETIKSKNSSPTTNILFLSNIMKSKGIFDFLTAIDLLFEEKIKIKVDIAGDFLEDYFMSKKEVRGEFEKQFTPLKNKMFSQINFYNSVSGTTKVQLLAKTDLFILPTYHRAETFPLALVEALRAGAVILTTRHNYIPQFISGKNGMFIQAHTPLDIKNKIMFFIKNKDKMKKIQKYNMQYAKKHFSLDSYQQQINKIINHSLGD
jgi:glycosyltransferase involved in cell wall biosynthesis